MDPKKRAWIIALAVFIVAAVFVVFLFLAGVFGPSVLTVAEIRAAGKCIKCHRRETPAIVETFEMGPHAEAITCYDCHHPLPGQEVMNHRGFEVVRVVTAGNCAECHPEQYSEHIRSRHGAPAWTAVARRDF